MTDRPILFSAPMIRALLEGRKTQTRRILKPQPEPWATKIIMGPLVQPIKHRGTGEIIGMSATGRPGDMIQSDADDNRQCGCGRLPWLPGDRLWVREAWRAHAEHDDIPPRDIPSTLPIQYLADEPLSPWNSKTRQSMFMPRWASRLTIAVTDVRVQRLQDIDHRDACAEGWPGDETERAKAEAFNDCNDACIEWFGDLWTSIYGPGAWAANPWVMAVTFDVHQCNIDKMAA